MPASTVTHTTTTSSALSVKDVFLGVLDVTLPDLGFSRPLTQDDVLNQSSGLNLNQTQELSQELISTEEELNALDALLSLQDVRENIPTDNIGLDDNSLLMPIGGHPICEDVVPAEIRLGQVDVDGEIAKIISVEELDATQSCNEANKMTELIGIPPNVDEEPTSIPIMEQQSTSHDNTAPKTKSEERPVTKSNSKYGGARPKIPTSEAPQEKPVTKKGSRGAFKSQLFGLRKRSPKDRSYYCQVCGVSKRSMESLNSHHRDTIRKCAEYVARYLILQRLFLTICTVITLENSIVTNVTSTVTLQANWRHIRLFIMSSPRSNACTPNVGIGLNARGS